MDPDLSSETSVDSHADTSGILTDSIDSLPCESTEVDENYCVYAELKQTKNELHQAAQLGKNLLLENVELKRLNDQLSEEFSQKIEELTQEKHQLKLQLEARISEFRLAEADHRADIEDLQQQLEDARKRSQSRERVDRQQIDDLALQNERLSEQILSESQNEERLREQVSAMRLSVSGASDGEQECHPEQLDALKAEMSEMQADFEMRLALKREECDALASDIERANERLSLADSELGAMTERLHQMETKFHQQEDINMQLLLKLENISMSATAPRSPTMETSLFAELELLSSSLSVDSFNNKPSKQVAIGTQLKQEILEVFRQLQRLTLEVQGRADEWSPEAVDISDLHAGQLLTTLTGLRTLVNHRLQPTSTRTSDKGPCVDVLQRQIAGLKEQLANSLTRAATLEAELVQRDKQLIRTCDEMNLLKAQFTSNQSELVKVRKEKDKLMDRSTGTLTTDDVLLAARRERDEALQTVDDLRQQLTKAQVDFSALDRQLLDAISQNDMQDLIAAKMADEMARDSMKRSSSSNNNSSSNSSKDKTSLKSDAVATSPSTKKRFSLRWS